MHIALPDLGLIAAVPPKTAGQPESIRPTDTAWAEAMLLDLGEVTAMPAAVPLALTPPVNPEDVALALAPENAVPVPALFVFANLLPLDGEVPTPTAIAPEVVAEVDQAMPSDPPSLETAEVTAPVTPPPFALNPEIVASALILGPLHALPPVSDNTSDVSQKSSSALQADVASTKPLLNVVDLEGKSGGNLADSTYAATVPISLSATDIGMASVLLPPHLQPASVPTVAPLQGIDRPEDLLVTPTIDTAKPHTDQAQETDVATAPVLTVARSQWADRPEVPLMTPTSDTAKPRNDQAAQIDVAGALGLDASLAIPHLTPQPKPTAKQGFIAVATEAAVQQASPAQIMFASSPKMPIQIVTHAQTPSRIAAATGALGETIALGWSLWQDQIFEPAAVTTIKDLQVGLVADTPQIDSIAAEPGQSLLEQNMPGQSLPDASAPANEPPSLATATAQSAATPPLATADPSSVRDDALISGSHVSARTEDFAASPTQPSPVQQAKAAVLARAMTEVPGQIDLTLTPEDLGALRFEMKPEATGMAITLSAERPETLDLMRRNVADLIAELKDAGVETGSFSFGAWSDRHPPANTPMDVLHDFATDIQPSPPPPQALPSISNLSGGLDLRL